MPNFRFMGGYKIDSPEEQTERTFLNGEHFFVRDQGPIPWDNESIGKLQGAVHDFFCADRIVNGYNCSKNGFVPK